MKWTVGSKIALAFSFALLVFIAVGMVSYRSASELIAATNSRQQSFLAIDALNESQVAVRNIGLALRTYLLTGEPAQYESLKAAHLAIDLPLQHLRSKATDDAAQLQQADRISAMAKDYVAHTLAVAELRRSKNQAAAVETMLAGSQLQTMTRALSDFDDQLSAVVAKRANQSDDEARFTRSAILFGYAAAVALAVVAGFIITRHIAVPLRALTSGAERVTAGDLTAAPPMGERSDEIGVLSRALERMTQSLRDVANTANLIANGDLRTTVKAQSDVDVLGTAISRMSNDLRQQFRDLVEGVAVLSAAASEIVASSSQLAASASQSAAAVSQTTTTVEEVRHTSQLASQKAKLVSDMAQRALQVTENGRRSTQDVEAGMTRIRNQMENIAAGMVQLSERNQAVGQVIAAVEDLSTQSNMLAVNAAIEAAKAGEHGKGFSVVAQEVKSLAEQSRQATAQVRTILGDIQKATAAAVMATEEGGKVVEVGAHQAEVAGGAVQSLGGSVNEAAQAALQIAASSQQQQVGMDQVAAAMDSIRQATSQNVASASQLEATARNISDLGLRLKQMVDRFQV